MFQWTLPYADFGAPRQWGSIYLKEMSKLFRRGIGTLKDGFLVGLHSSLIRNNNIWGWIQLRSKHQSLQLRNRSLDSGNGNASQRSSSRPRSPPIMKP